MNPNQWTGGDLTRGGSIGVRVENTPGLCTIKKEELATKGDYSRKINMSHFHIVKELFYCLESIYKEDYFLFLTNLLSSFFSS